MKYSEAAVSIADLLKDEHVDVRMAAIGALGALKNPVAVPDLVRFLEHEKTDEIMLYALIKSLGEIGDARAFPHLVSLFERPDEAYIKPYIRGAVVHAIGGIKTKEALSFLIEKVLRDKNWRVRMDGVLVLGELKPQEAVVPLEVLLKDSNQRVGEQAERALKAIKWR